MGLQSDGCVPQLRLIKYYFNPMTIRMPVETVYGTCVTKNIIMRVKREGEKAGMYFNIKKTKVMTTEEWTTLEVDEVEMVSLDFAILIGQGTSLHLITLCRRVSAFCDP